MSVLGVWVWWPDQAKLLADKECRVASLGGRNRRDLEGGSKIEGADELTERVQTHPSISAFQL